MAKAKWAVLTALVAVTASVSLYATEPQPQPPSRALAQPGPEGGKARRFQGEGRRGAALFRLLRDEDVRDRLGLDESQRRSLDNLFFESSQRAIQLQADLKSLRLEMARLGKQENPDRAALEAQLERIAAVRTEMARLRLDGMFQIRDILTPEQRASLKEIAKERRGRRRGPG